MRKILPVFWACLASSWAYGQNVGIGTATPLNRLHVDGAAPADANGGQLRISAGTDYLLIGRTASYGFLQSHNNEPLSLNPLGNNVGIGTVAPAQRLDVQGGTIRVSALAHTNTYDRMVVANANGDLGLGDAPYGFNVHSTTLGTTVSKTAGGWANLLSITFTPRHNRVFVFASFTARLTNNVGYAQFGQASVRGRILVGGTPAANAAQVITDYDYDGVDYVVVTSGTVAFAGIPVTVTPGTPVTITLQWDITVLWATNPWQVRIAPGVAGDHAVLTIFD